MERVIKNGEVAVLYSPGYGAGWSTWNQNSTVKQHLLFDSRLVNLVLEDQKQEITEELVREITGVDDEVYLSLHGLDKVKVEWIPQGVAFRVCEYDGNESIELQHRIVDIFIA